jgi:hypothetical protein
VLTVGGDFGGGLAGVIGALDEMETVREFEASRLETVHLLYNPVGTTQGVFVVDVAMTSPQCSAGYAIRGQRHHKVADNGQAP